MAEDYANNMKQELEKIRNLKESQLKENNQFKRDYKRRENDEIAMRESQIRDNKFYNENGTSPGPDAKPVDKWGKVANNADRLMHDSQESYKDWAANMFAIFATLRDLVSALNYSRDNAIRNIAGVFSNAGNWKLTRMGKDLYHSKKKEDIVVGLTAAVTMGDDNKIDISLEKPSGINFNGKVDGYFKQGIDKWLFDNGYEPDPNNENGYRNRENSDEKLDKNTFEKTLKNDEENGLEHFLSGLDEDLEFTKTSIASPRP